MARINPKLNLNKTPQNVEDSSLVFAKNIKLNKELSICPDSAVKGIKHWVGEDDENPGLVGKIVGVNNKIYFFTSNEEDSIFEYDELTEEVNRVNCSWTYNGGEITGCVTVNNTGEQILTVAEYNTQADVPIKHINLSKCSDTDDESIYTQHPNIPITNLLLSGYYTCNIPNGVYQFFIRYKIRDEFYTNWFPASKLLFAGNTNTLDTIQGKLKYTNINRDAEESFVLNPEHLFEEYNDIYKEFQIGFIINTDNGTFARSWKSFSFSTKEIYFDYKEIEEINIDDLIKTTYELFNVKNVVNYKNKLYISNYNETNFNVHIEDSDKIEIKTKKVTLDDQSVSPQINGGVLVKSNDNNNYYDFISIITESTSIGKKIYANDEYCKVLTSRLSEDPCSGTGYTQKSLSSITKVAVPEYLLNSYKIEKGDVLCIYTDINNTPYKIFADKDVRPTSQDFSPLSIFTVHTSNENEIINAVISAIKNSYVVLGIYDNNNDQDDPNNFKKFYINTKDYGNSAWSGNIVEEFYIYYSINRKSNRRYYQGSGYTGWVWDVTKYLYLVKVICNLKDGIVTFDYNTNYPHKYNTNTLLFKTKYDFYVNYVKQNGVITNGQYVDTKYLTSSRLTDDFDRKSVIYPYFDKITKPEDYVACFFSMKKANTIVCELFNVNSKEISEENYVYRADCLELDSLLYNLNNNITIITDKGLVVTRTAKYHPSGDTSTLNNFGTAGFVEWTYSAAYEDTVNYYIVSELNDTDSLNNLIKVTPFIKLTNEADTSYDNYLNLNLLGYICDVSKINREGETIDNVNIPGADDYYVSGTDVFTKNINNVSRCIELNEYKEFAYTRLGKPNIRIKSSFNLNFLSLTQLITPQIRTYKDNNDEQKQQIFSGVNSLISSSIYTLENMYKTIDLKRYSTIDDNKLYIFNNTVRSSNIDVDEVYRDIYKFEAEDYYNVPTNRGIIVNLFSIINKIYVHCEHALFVFTDTNMMKVGENLYTSNNTEVALQQSSPFEIGIQEIFDSEYGYAGLQNKKHSLITFNSYIFYDKLAKTIYAYSGDSVPTAISDGIDKILKWFEPDDIMFAADNTNNRFFINLRKEINNEIKNICLSFNFTSKSFVSIHDIDFDESFNSRINTYFQKNNQGENNNEVNVYKIDNDNINDYSFLKKISILQLADVDDIFANSINEVANSIDVICNLQYETVKNLNWINWICREVNNYNVNPTITVAEEDGKLYSGHYIRIYSDETYSPLIPLTNNENEPLRSNDVPLMAGERAYNPQANTYPRYNCGVWSMNNFRDIRNYTDIYLKYKASLQTKVEKLYPDYEIGHQVYNGVDYFTKTKNGITTKVNNPQNYSDSDNKSLLYGKYFVVRFIFKDKNFKLENIKFNMGNYEKS